MKELSEARKNALAELFHERMTDDPTERRLYAHDVGELPKIMASFSGDTVPTAVVQPVNEGEVVSLVRWAAAEKVQLTPRGMATSGYFGAVPTRSGIVVEMKRMASVLAIDAENQTVTVEPGIRWEMLEKRLRRQGLALRLYPSSFPSSTVGGWVGQGGFGYGSYEFGAFGKSLVSLRAVTAEGEARNFTGPELDLVYEAEGITGIVTAVTLKVQTARELQPFLIQYKTAVQLQTFIHELISSDAPAWSASFINPSMAEMKNRVPAGHHGHHATLPEAFLVLVTGREGADTVALEKALKAIAVKTGAEILDESLAREEWENRFRVLMIKRMAPSLIPAEVVVPVDALAAFFEKVERDIAPAVVSEGLLVRAGKDGKPEAVLLGFIPGDARKLSFTLAYGLSLSVIKIAEDLGGRAYSTGAYFSSKADSVLGAEKVANLRAFKEKTDPDGIMNPGKVLESGIIGGAISATSAFEPLVRRVGNSQAQVADEPRQVETRGIPADVAYFAHACSQCGYCVDTCTQYYGRGWESQSPRGKWYWLRLFMDGKVEWNQKMVDTIISCTTCEVCDRRCPGGLPIESSWMKMRGKLIHEDKHMSFPAFEVMSASLVSQGNIWSGYRSTRADWFPAELEEKHGEGRQAEWIYFVGCTASTVEHDIAIGTAKLLDRAGVDFTTLGTEESCCAIPMLVAGKWQVFEATMRKNIELVKKAGAKGVVTSCPACLLMWAKGYPQWCETLGIPFDLKAKHYSEIIAEKIKTGDFTVPDKGRDGKVVTFHDSCHLGRAQGIYEPPREMIKCVPGVELREMEHNREDALCCGSVLTLAKDPIVSAKVGKDRLDEATQAGVSEVITLCPCCQVALRVAAKRRDLPVRVTDLTHFVADALGIELPDPHPEVHARWNLYESFFSLLTPRGFAELMSSMWPEVMDAVPVAMGTMMRGMAIMPGALEAMKPMFPVFLPLVLPKMMPKLFSTIERRIGQLIPMPGYMAEQMGDLLPKVVDNLLPHMLGDVVSLVTPSLIEYLKGGKAAEDLQRRLYESVTRDELTSCYNRKCFLERLPNELAHSKRHSKTLSVAIMDIDHLKSINDTHGQAVGDHILRSVAEVMRRTVRFEEFLARYGGEEFVLIMRETPASKALLAAERIRRQVEGTVFEFEGIKIPVTISVGVATWSPGEPDAPDELVKVAGECLCKAKNNGRNRSECAVS